MDTQDATEVDGYTECQAAMSELQDRPDGGRIALDVLSNVIMSSLDPETLGKITARIKTSIADRERDIRRERLEARAYHPIRNPGGDTTIGPGGSYRGVE